MPPADAVDPGVSFDVALEVDVDAFPDRAGVQVAAQLQDHQWHVWITLINYHYEEEEGWISCHNSWL